MTAEAQQPTVEYVTDMYIKYRDAVAQMKERQSEELRPYTEAMMQLENWLHAKMQQDGVDSYKTSAGTPYRQVATSIKIENAESFKDFVLEPAADSIYRAMIAAGYPLAPASKDYILMLLKQEGQWGMVDFRVGKKGVEEWIENQRGELPPGLGISQYEKVNVRRS